MKKYSKNRGGRPKATDAQIKEHMVCIRLDAVGYLRLEEPKMQSGKSASGVIRELITRGYVRERMRRVHLDHMAQFKGVARNLNQITRLANARYNATEAERLKKEAEAVRGGAAKGKK